MRISAAYGLLHMEKLGISEKNSIQTVGRITNMLVQLTKLWGFNANMW
jgi:hypothetical protein